MYKTAMARITEFVSECARHLCHGYKCGRIDETNDVLLRQITPFSVYAGAKLSKILAKKYDNAIAHYLVHLALNNPSPICSLSSTSLYTPGQDSLHPRYALIDVCFVLLRSAVLAHFFEMLLSDTSVDAEPKRKFIESAYIADPQITRRILKSPRLMNTVEKYIPFLVLKGGAV